MRVTKKLYGPVVPFRRTDKACQTCSFRNKVQCARVQCVTINGSQATSYHYVTKWQYVKRGKIVIPESKPKPRPQRYQGRPYEYEGMLFYETPWWADRSNRFNKKSRIRPLPGPHLYRV